MTKALAALASLALLVMYASGQNNGSPINNPGKTMTDSLNTQVAFCTFADGNQLSVRYNQLSDRREDFSFGKVWPPSSSIFLFTPVALTIAGSAIPPGAFSLYVIPEHHEWTLIVNKNVAEGDKYDETKDLLRTPMETGQAEQPEKKFTVYFAHMAPKQCNMRLYQGNTGSWAEFMEK